MTRDTNATPLIALDAVVIDTETTGLDPARARVIEFGAIRIDAGKLDDDKTFRRLIDPGEPIPEVATHIHHISDADVAGAPGFAASWPDVTALMSDTVVIGHTVGFDLAVLKRECERAGLPWRPPRSLCTRMLSQVVAPHLSGYSLEHLSSWLGLEVEGRHSAVADARMTARIFLALLPKLREQNIRTLAEAEQAVRNLGALMEDQHRAGWEDSVLSPSRRETQVYARIDTYPYRHRVRDVMSAPPKFIAASVPLGEVLNRMTTERISSLLVAAAPDAAMRPNDTGIITERDVMRALTHNGPVALTRPAAEFASKPLVTLPEAAFVYRALGRMSRLGLRHLGVVNEDGEVCGIVTSRDLLRLRALEATVLGDAVVRADDVPALGAAWARLPLA
ncbi:MAG: exonuclease domain-containing protein, partial [Xanthobacteraceae bacterium]